jgi:hypothetical protein
MICSSNRHTNQLARRQQFSCTVLEVSLAAIRHNMYTPDLLSPSRTDSSLVCLLWNPDRARQAKFQSPFIPRQQ